MMELLQVSDWRRTLGYLPVPLSEDEAEQRFVMLNGAKGNFCLDISGQEPARAEQREVAWSSDVDHYVRVSMSGIEVLRWDQPEPVRSSVDDVVNNLRAFQNYLETARAPRELSIVSHALGIYNRIRSVLPEGSAGLEAFLFALQQASDDTVRNMYWVDKARCEASWSQVGSSTRGRIMADLLSPKGTDKRPRLPLVLRHAMGRIFQEAHNLVMLSPQMSLLDEGDLISLGSTSRSSGAYFTPTPLVRTLVEQCLTPELLARPQLTLIDPACGSGEFLRESVRQLSLHNYRGELRIVGFDVSLPAILMARFALAHETRGWGKRVTVEIEQCDALNTAWPQQVDICLMNPPYASWGSLSVSARALLTESLGSLAQSRPDLAFAFLTKGVESLTARGMMGAVLPASLLDGRSAEPLRARLDALAFKQVVVRLGNQSIFEQATVDASLYVGCRQAEPLASTPPALMVWADHTSGASDRALRTLRSLDWTPSDGVIEIDHGDYSIYSEVCDGAADWAPRPLTSTKLLRRYKPLPRLSSLYTINQGTITGLNDAFVLNDKEYKMLPRPERDFFRKAIINASIRDGQIHDGNWVFYPYGESIPTLDSESKLFDLLPQYVRKYLEPNKSALRRRAGIDDTSWWHLTRKRTVHERFLPKIVSTYFGNAGSFAWDSTGEYVVVQGYAWTPTSGSTISEKSGLAAVAILSSATRAIAPNSHMPSLTFR
ncbi:MAG: N-6 DNA methylase [Proteobacteria bacterium]|nr:N-6 DNA methylase [Pseudomonadota bacterium]